jgi:Icc-related predicted phosphoesterase
LQIVQGTGYVAILQEMMHEVRLIPLDGRSHVDSNIRGYMGDSRGHWDGDTLVIDTTNFIGKSNFYGADENMHLTERLTRTEPGTILYEFTVDDPTAFVRPWSGELSMRKSQEGVVEYACHEGNYSMTNILAGARAAEKNEFDGLKPMIAVCHVPPQGTMLDRITNLRHAGSRSMRAFLQREQPRYFFCGHIHEAAGAQEKLGETSAMNVGKKGYLLDLEKQAELGLI